MGKRMAERQTICGAAVRPGPQVGAIVQLLPARRPALLQQVKRNDRRKTITLSDQNKVLVDLPQSDVPTPGDEPLLEPKRVDVAAAKMGLHEITAHAGVQLANSPCTLMIEICPATISAERTMISQEHLIKAVPKDLGAVMHEIAMPLNSVRGGIAGTWTRPQALLRTYAFSRSRPWLSS